MRGPLPERTLGFEERRGWRALCGEWESPPRQQRCAQETPPQLWAAWLRGLREERRAFRLFGKGPLGDDLWSGVGWEGVSVGYRTSVGGRRGRGTRNVLGRRQANCSPSQGLPSRPLSLLSPLRSPTLLCPPSGQWSPMTRTWPPSWRGWWTSRKGILCCCST